MHPDRAKGVPDRPRLRDLVLVMREDRGRVPPPWISNSGPRYFSAMAEHSMCHPGRPRPHGESHARVLARLVRLPEREVALVFLQRVRLLLLDSSGFCAREPPVVGKAGDAVVHVPVRPGRRCRTRRAPRSARRSPGSSRSRAAHVGHGRARGRRCPADTRQSRRRASSALRSRSGLVDPVVDVGDVVDDVTSYPDSRSHFASHEKMTKGRPFPMWTRVRTPSGRTRTCRSSRRRRQIDDVASERVVQAHRAIVLGGDQARSRRRARASLRRAAARREPRRARALPRRPSARVAATAGHRRRP